MKALILGCSHAAGNEIISPGYDDPEKSYPMIIARSLGYHPTNMSIIGGSNDAMFRLAEQYHQNYDLVIACWTGADRTEVWDGNSWQAIAPGGWPISIEEYRTQWLLHSTDFETSRFNKLKNVLALNAMCSSVINIDSFYPVRNFKWKPDVYWPTAETFYDWCNKKNYAHTKYGHFFEDAHQAFAHYLLQRLDTKYVDNNNC